MRKEKNYGKSVGLGGEGGYSLKWPIRAGSARSTNGRINSDRFSKRALKAQAYGGWGGGEGFGYMLPQESFGILTFKSPLFLVSESFRQDIVGKLQ